MRPVNRDVSNNVFNALKLAEKCIYRMALKARIDGDKATFESLSGQLVGIRQALAQAEGKECPYHNVTDYDCKTCK